MKVDDRFVYQLVAHLCRLNISECHPSVKSLIQMIKHTGAGNEFCKYRSDVRPV
jgi:hypothetical protein